MTTALAIIALVVSLGALGVAGWNARSDSRSATAAEDSAVTSRQSADHARESAEHAKASADAAERMVQAEAERHHLAHEPAFNGKFRFERRRGTPEFRALTYQFNLDRGYAVKARVSRDNGNNYAEAVVAAPARADGVWKVFVEDWSTDRKERQWEKLEVRFWPPQAVPGRAAPWTCRCGSEVNPGDHPGHWDWVISIDPPKPVRAVIAG